MRRWFLIRLLALSSVAICFYISYFFTNWFTVQRITTLGQNVPEIIFAWEHHLPFIDWTIIPYWSLNLLYGCGFLLCKTDTEVKRYSLQLLTAQVIATMCFLTFPLQISWAKPVELSGFIGFLFKSLTELDLPYNQAPSLHIILSVIVGALYVAKAPWRWLKWGIIVWFVFISISVLTTFQHHFIDIPTGILVGSLILCGMPIQGQIVIPNVKRTASHRKWAIIYGLLALLTVLLSFTLGGTWLWLLWLSVSFILLSLSYLFFGTQLFRKRATGCLAASAGWLFFPYLLIARLNTHYWIDLKREKRAVEILPEISIGSILTAKDYSAVFDLTAEITYSPRENQHYFNFPLLDMVLPTTEQLASASRQLEQIVRTKQPVLICCALGYGRSVAVLLTWLVCYRQYSFTQALDLIRAARPNAVINEELEQNILRLSRYYQKLD